MSDALINKRTEKRDKSARKVVALGTKAQVVHFKKYPELRAVEVFQATYHDATELPEVVRARIKDRLERH